MPRRDRKPLVVSVLLVVGVSTQGPLPHLLPGARAFAQDAEDPVEGNVTPPEEPEGAIEVNAANNAANANPANNAANANAANANAANANPANANAANANAANANPANNAANANAADADILPPDDMGDAPTENDFSLGDGEADDAFGAGDKGVPANAAGAPAPENAPAENVSVPAPPPEPVPDEAAPSAPVPVPPAAADASSENLPVPPPIGDAGALSYASEARSGRGPGAMSEDDMRKARELATKLKELPLGTAPEEYVVQPGDTLWDISDQFLDDPFWWPKLWSLNANEIANPNLIYPGMVLVFTPSDGAQGPLLSARDTEAFINPVSLESSTLQSKNPLANQWRGGRDGEILDADELPKDEGVLSMGDFQASTAYAFRIPGFMTNEDVDAVGEVLSLASSPSLAIVGAVSYARFEATPKEGERYLALRKVEDIVEPNGDRPDIPLYVYVATVGVVHINASGVASMFVEAGPSGVMPGDVLVPHRNLYVQVNPGADTRKSSLRSRVVGVLDDNVWLAGEAQAVFLEKSGAVSVGEEVDLYMPPGGSPLYGEDDDELDRVKVATARVVEVGNETVTAVVLTATREITVGATTHARP